MAEEYIADFPSEFVKEGMVEVLVPKLSAFGVVPSDYAPSRAPVFYNPVMEFNRDLSVLVCRAYQQLVKREISICEPLTSQGVRGIRYAVEVEGVSRVLLSDINHHAYELAQFNVKRNNLQDKIVLKHRDANCVLNCNAAPKKRFDVVDIDPFGTPVPFLDSAFRALKNRGLIAVTATDLAPLCGVHAKACVRKYGGKPMRTEYCHELAIRLLAGCMVQVAAMQDMGVRFLFSHSSDHYIRVYAQVGYGCQKADVSLKSVGYILHCFNCLHRETVRQLSGGLVCRVCGEKMDYAGPLWVGSINDESFVSSVFAENSMAGFRGKVRLEKLLSLIKSEAEAPITYFVLDNVCKKAGLPAVSVQSFVAALNESGYSVVQTHFNTRGIKTDASATAMQDTLKQLVVSRA
ncbi:MAG: tRNA (guanine(10)-N(2))-dimethyltransferase [Candidatus Bathyarchaeota archaeon]|nr:tRNA (guanine(10)-N(2))-dimethyltransferase [Candidatus Termiticorpusculum sp.]